MSILLPSTPQSGIFLCLSAAEVPSIFSNVVVDRGATLAADSIFLLFGEDERSAGYALISTLCYCMNLIRKDKHKTPGYLSSQTSLLELNGVIIDHIATQGRKAVMQASLPMLVWHSNSIKPIDSSNC